MITKEQLKDLTKRNKINESVIAREYVQLTILKELYSKNFSKDVYFKGGTALRLVYGGNRFSEDLDFSVILNDKEFSEEFNKLSKHISRLYPYTIKERKSITGKTYLITAKLNEIKSDLFVRLDFSMRENVIDPQKMIVSTEYPIILQNFINTLSKNEILAEKIRAIIKRKKHRDIYDIWQLLESGAKMHPELINTKIAYYNEKFDKNELVNSLEKFNKEEFISDIRPFVPINERSKLPELYEYVIEYLRKEFEK